MLAPAYGSRALADLLPSVLASLGVEGEPDVLGLAPVRRTVLLLVDGLGSRLLERHAHLAPFLSSQTARPLTAGFPTTTATSLSSLGTGLPPGEHGITGYTTLIEDRTMSWLGWDERGSDLRASLPPEQVQPRATVFERAARAGVTTTVAGLARFDGSGLTRAVLRGGTYAGVVSPGDTVARVGQAVREGERSLVYCYTPDLDLTGHVRGVDSEAWREQLRVVDAFAEQLLSRLPTDARLLVTGDHGMVDVAAVAQVDYDACPDLQAGVRVLTGEPRARHLHVEDGADDDVVGAWSARLGDRAHVLLREEAIDGGLLGPVVTDDARARTGDVVVLASAELAVVRKTVEPWVARLRGHHGALTTEELDVPLLLAGA